PVVGQSLSSSEGFFTMISTSGAYSSSSTPMSCRTNTGLPSFSFRVARCSCATVVDSRLLAGATLLFAVRLLKYLVTSWGVRLKVNSLLPSSRVISRLSLMLMLSLRLKKGCRGLLPANPGNVILQAEHHLAAQGKLISEGEIIRSSVCCEFGGSCISH